MTQWIDATFVRGGTSKGLFFAESALPPLSPGLALLRQHALIAGKPIAANGG